MPTLALFHPHKMAADLLKNPTPDVFQQNIESQNEFYRLQFEQEKLKAFREIEDMVKSCGFFAFIKGSPE